MTSQNVVLAGATGMIGRPILQHLLSQNFNVTVLTRDLSKIQNDLNQLDSTNLNIVQVDYTAHESLVSHVKGHDAAISALARAASQDEERLIDACIAAGVPRFIPSAFGGDMQVPWVRNQPFWADKVQQEEYLLKKVNENKDTFSYTLFTNGAVLDFVLQMKLFVNMPERKIVLYDGGERLLSTTTKDTIGKAVVEVLKRPDETKNKNLYIEGAIVNQSQLLKLAQELTPGEEWTIIEMDTEPLWKQAVEKWASGLRGFAAGAGFLVKGLFSEGFSGAFTRSDNDMLGVQKMSEAEVKDFLARFL